MNNEEKILEMLEKMNSRMDQMQMELSGRMDQMQMELSDRMDQITGRMDQVSDRVDQMQGDQRQMRDDIQGIKLRFELDADKRFNAVDEGINAILEQLTPKSRIDEMEADIIALKAAVKTLFKEVEELKKAQ